MEKKWDTVTPADLKRLCKWDIHGPQFTKGLKLKRARLDDNRDQINVAH